ncbi:MAG: type I methionyl aminopeptidase [Candidatus Omnitrophica bacterium]|nr:type I methionyl aminopeptidase [Candidatus Omnitrophota bacterium]
MKRTEIKKAGRVASRILAELGSVIKEGITGIDINNFTEDFVSRYYPDFNLSSRGYNGFPASLCVSVNEGIIHGIPSKRIIKNGDLVKVDIVVDHQGWFADTAMTYMVGNVSLEAKKLVKTTRSALYEAIEAAKQGNTTGDLGYIIQNCVRKRGFSVIKEFGGHGIGKEMHMEPFIPNFGKRGEGSKLIEGMIVAIETMVFAGKSDIEIADDGWTVKSKDNSLTAHFEHTVLITKNKPVIITN